MIENITDNGTKSVIISIISHNKTYYRVNQPICIQHNNAILVYIDEYSANGIQC